MRRRVPAEEQSDDEVRTSLVPDRREGENKGNEVTVPTACGMRRRVPAEEQSDDEARTSLVPD
ncbi:hypothetical protein [Veillonella sp.]|uniref:hypothetical protein n=1 Tax=Veillonella sp. TaxID=1926307 RepID=UPI0025803172|nr:hypothetical protein [Veillonella sp.]MBS6227804.1 hypothetical protein [Veillonella sp.]